MKSEDKATGRIKPVVDRVFEYAELQAAKAFMESTAQVGKIAVRMAVLERVLSGVVVN